MDEQQKTKTLQDIMAGELFASSRSDLVETLKFMENTVPHCLSVR